MEIDIKGHSVIIDDEDYEKVASMPWYVQYGYGKKKGHIYFYHSVSKPNTKKYNISLQRFLMRCQLHDGMVVDHINGNTLDNRKQNLRVCTFAENIINQKRRNDNTTGYKGVSFHVNVKKFIARISVGGNRLHLGCFDTAEEAYAAYCEASKKYHGEFGRIA